MKADNGFITLHRKMVDWEWYDDINTKVVFLHLLLTANWKDSKWHGVDVLRGQRIISYGGLAKETKLSVRAVRTCLERLKSTGETTSQATSQYTIVTLVNYSKYQDQATNETTSQTTNERHASDMQTTCERQQLNKDNKDNKETIKDIVGENGAGAPAIEPINYQVIIALYNNHCSMLSKCTKMSAARKKAIKARFNTGYMLSDFEKLFQMTADSDFLKGANNRNWQANFDWLIKDSNMAKVLDGNYDNKSKGAPKKPQPNYECSEDECL